MSPSPSTEGSQEDTEDKIVSHQNFKPLQLFHPQGIENNEDASVQSALPPNSPSSAARAPHQFPQASSSSAGINLQNYSRSAVSATYMFSPHDVMNAGALIDPSPLITRRLDDRNRRRSDGAVHLDADDNYDLARGNHLGNTNHNGDDGESLVTPSTSSEIGQVELLGEDENDAESPLDGRNYNASEDNNRDGTGGEQNDNNSWDQTFHTIRHPISSTKTYFINLSSIFTWEFLSYLGVVNFFILGGAFTLVMALGLPLFKELGIDASRQQLYMTMIMSPWAMKPFIGVRLYISISFGELTVICVLSLFCSLCLKFYFHYSMK